MPFCLNIFGHEELSMKIEIQPALLLGDFSIDGDRNYCAESKKNMKFLILDFRTTQVNIDLKEDMVDLKAKDIRAILQERMKMTFICQWILINKSKLFVTESSTFRIFPDFILRRGIMGGILRTTYPRTFDGDWSLQVVKYRETVYISNDYSEDEIIDRWPNSTKSEDSSYCRKFQLHMTGQSGSCDDNEEYYCVVDSTLSNHRLMIYGDIDGIDYVKSNTPNINACMDLKSTTILEEHWASEAFIGYDKPMKWWAHSAVFGISEIVCGFRDKQKIIRGIEVIKVEELPNYKNMQCQFDTNVMLQFGVRFFDWLKTAITEENPTMYLVRFYPSRGIITCGKTSKASFITQSYIEKMFLD